MKTMSKKCSIPSENLILKSIVYNLQSNPSALTTFENVVNDIQLWKDIAKVWVSSEYYNKANDVLNKIIINQALANPLTRVKMYDTMAQYTLQFNRRHSSVYNMINFLESTNTIPWQSNKLKQALFWDWYKWKIENLQKHIVNMYQEETKLEEWLKSIGIKKEDILDDSTKEVSYNKLSSLFKDNVDEELKLRSKTLWRELDDFERSTILNDKLNKLLWVYASDQVTNVLMRADMYDLDTVINVVSISHLKNQTLTSATEKAIIDLWKKFNKDKWAFMQNIYKSLDDEWKSIYAKINNYKKWDQLASQQDSFWEFTSYLIEQQNKWSIQDLTYDAILKAKRQAEGNKVLSMTMENISLQDTIDAMSKWELSIKWVWYKQALLHHLYPIELFDAYLWNKSRLFLEWLWKEWEQEYVKTIARYIQEIKNNWWTSYIDLFSMSPDLWKELDEVSQELSKTISKSKKDEIVLKSIFWQELNMEWRKIVFVDTNSALDEWKKDSITTKLLDKNKAVIYEWNNDISVLTVNPWEKIKDAVKKSEYSPEITIFVVDQTRDQSIKLDWYSIVQSQLWTTVSFDAVNGKTTLYLNAQSRKQLDKALWINDILTQTINNTTKNNAITKKELDQYVNKYYNEEVKQFIIDLNAVQITEDNITEFRRLANTSEDVSWFVTKLNQWTWLVKKSNKLRSRLEDMLLNNPTQENLDVIYSHIEDFWWAERWARKEISKIDKDTMTMLINDMYEWALWDYTKYARAANTLWIVVSDADYGRLSKRQLQFSFVDKIPIKQQKQVSQLFDELIANRTEYSTLWYEDITKRLSEKAREWLYGMEFIATGKKNNASEGLRLIQDIYAELENIRQSTSFFDVLEKPILENIKLSPLYEEARKYKSADDMINWLEKDGKILYHWWNKQIDQFDLSKSKIWDAVFISKDRWFSDVYAWKRWRVTKIVLDNDAKIIDFSNKSQYDNFIKEVEKKYPWLAWNLERESIREWLSKKDYRFIESEKFWIKEALKEFWYDWYTVFEEWLPWYEKITENIWIINTDKIKTEAQLRKIREEANTKTTPTNNYFDSKLYSTILPSSDANTKLYASFTDYQQSLTKKEITQTANNAQSNINKDLQELQDIISEYKDKVWNASTQQAKTSIINTYNAKFKLKKNEIAGKYTWLSPTFDTQLEKLSTQRLLTDITKEWTVESQVKEMRKTAQQVKNIVEDKLRTSNKIQVAKDIMENWKAYIVSPEWYSLPISIDDAIKHNSKKLEWKVAQQINEIIPQLDRLPQKAKQNIFAITQAYHTKSAIDNSLHTMLWWNDAWLLTKYTKELYIGRDWVPVWLKNIWINDEEKNIISTVWDDIRKNISKWEPYNKKNLDNITELQWDLKDRLSTFITPYTTSEWIDMLKTLQGDSNISIVQNVVSKNIDNIWESQSILRELQSYLPNEIKQNGIEWISLDNILNRNVDEAIATRKYIPDTERVATKSLQTKTVIEPDIDEIKQLWQPFYCIK